MRTAFIALGSNMGDRLAHMRGAIATLVQHPELHLIDVSPVYESEPVGGPTTGPFLNGVLRLNTSMPAPELLDLLHVIEADAGRTRGGPTIDRTLDLDLLLYGEQLSDVSAPLLPHPRMHERRFVLQPLLDLAPELVDPRDRCPWIDTLLSLPEEGCHRRPNDNLRVLM